MRTARKQQCSRVLRNTFGVSGFRPGQEQAADALLDGGGICSASCPLAQAKASAGSFQR